MDTQHHEPQIGGVPVHVNNCYIWAAIYYLDSPTDYREYLPSNRERVLRPTEDLVMLGDKRAPGWVTVIHIMFVVGISLALFSLLMPDVN
jgi:hypothetical protein